MVDFERLLGWPGAQGVEFLIVGGVAATIHGPARSGAIDLPGEISGGGTYEELAGQTLEIDLFGRRHLTLDLDTLIRVKRAAGRPRNFDVIAGLEAIRDEHRKMGTATRSPRNVARIRFMKQTFVALAFVVALPAAAGTTCRMTFTMSGWSAFYKTSSGTGKIHCGNGQSAAVKVSSKGGGITFGRSKIKNGTGKFTEVASIEELFGSYAQGEAHAGAGKSTKAGVVTKGDISLTLTGKGSGVDVGVDFGKFTIERQ